MRERDTLYDISVAFIRNISVRILWEICINTQTSIFHLNGEQQTWTACFAADGKGNKESRFSIHSNLHPIKRCENKRFTYFRQSLSQTDLQLSHGWHLNFPRFDNSRKTIGRWRGEHGAIGRARDLESSPVVSKAIHKPSRCTYS